MKLQVNGEERDVSSHIQTVSDLLEELGLKEERVAVEVNQSVVPGDTYNEHCIEEGSQVEIVTFVGGG